MDQQQAEILFYLLALFLCQKFTFLAGKNLSLFFFFTNIKSF